MPASGSLLGPDFLPTTDLPTANLPALSLVVGGARSGKSRVAESLVTLTGRRRVYIATAQAFDDEMQARINQHQQDRGPDWRTIEAPLDLAPALATCQPDEVVLLDCATLWLTNHFLAEADLDAQTHALLAAFAACAAPVVVVSNETGWGIVPENRMARAFRDAQGRLNQRIAAQSGLVLGVMAGLPFALKGQMPSGLV